MWEYLTDISFWLIKITLLVEKIRFFALPVLFLVFFVEPTKEVGTNNVVLWQAASNNVPKDTS